MLLSRCFWCICMLGICLIGVYPTSPLTYNVSLKMKNQKGGNCRSICSLSTLPLSFPFSSTCPRRSINDSKTREIRRK